MIIDGVEQTRALLRAHRARPGAVHHHRSQRVGHPRPSDRRPERGERRDALSSKCLVGRLPSYTKHTYHRYIEPAAAWTAVAVGRRRQVWRSENRVRQSPPRWPQLSTTDPSGACATTRGCRRAVHRRDGHACATTGRRRAAAVSRALSPCADRGARCGDHELRSDHTSRWWCGDRDEARPPTHPRRRGGDDRRGDGPHGGAVAPSPRRREGGCAVWVHDRIHQLAGCWTRSSRLHSYGTTGILTDVTFRLVEARRPTRGLLRRLRCSLPIHRSGERAAGVEDPGRGRPGTVDHAVLQRLAGPCRARRGHRHLDRRRRPARRVHRPRPRTRRSDRAVARQGCRPPPEPTWSSIACSG